jgi:hypothetical protein
MSPPRLCLRVPSGLLLSLAGLLLALGGCSRSAVVVAPAVVAEQPARPPAPEGPQEESKPEPPAADGFPFPNDEGGDLLGKLLTPSAGPAPGEEGDGPRRFARPPAARTPEPPLPPTEADVVRLPVDRPATAPRPGPVPEGPPLADFRDTVPPPEPGRLAVGKRMRVPSEDMNRPVPLPLLGRPAPDRAPLDDPTADASLAAALAAPVPERTTPAPFVKRTLPDPFENRLAIRLPARPPEEAVPVAAAPRPPKP